MIINTRFLNESIVGRGIRKRVFAEKLGLSVPGFLQIMRGGGNFRADVLQRVRQELRLTDTEFLKLFDVEDGETGETPAPTTTKTTTPTRAAAAVDSSVALTEEAAKRTAV